MALLFIDGWDYYDTADLPKKWDALIADFDSNTPDLSSGTGRYSGQAVHLGPHGNSGLKKNLGDQLTMVVGFAVNYSTSSTYGQIMTFPGPSGKAQIILSLNNGTLSVGNSHFTQSSATAIVASTWNYVEIKVSSINATALAGAVVVKLNGVTVITTPGSTNTLGDDISGSNKMVGIIVGGSVTGTTDTSDLYIDDLYACNELGSANNDFLGDCRIEVIRPSAAGTTTQWTPDTGNNYARVNEDFQDGDTSYVKSDTVTQVDTYACDDLSTTFATILAVQVNMVARKDDIGARVITSAVKSGSTTYDKSTESPFGLADDYIEHGDVWELNPNGNVPWTTTTVNAMEVGVKLIF